VVDSVQIILLNEHFAHLIFVYLLRFCADVVSSPAMFSDRSDCDRGACRRERTWRVHSMISRRSG